MNILTVVPWDQEYGGVASVVGNVALELEKRGHKVLFLHPGADDTVERTITKWGFFGYKLNLRGPLVPAVMHFSKNVGAKMSSWAAHLKYSPEDNLNTWLKFQAAPRFVSLR